MQEVGTDKEIRALLTFAAPTGRTGEGCVGATGNVAAAAFAAVWFG